MGKLKAGAAQVDITPADSQFLFGYPHVNRYSTGVHDRLLSSSLYLSDGNCEAMFIANDIIFISKSIAERVRREIYERTSLKPEAIMISATHTHSGPITVDYVSNEADAAVPKADTAYISFLEKRIIESAVAAYKGASEATIGLGLGDDTGIGTNRRDPGGPADHQVPVMVVKRQSDSKTIACMLVCSMHPTVLHEDSTLISGDFLGFARIYLQENVFGRDCAILHHTGPSGNQSPRHVTRSNTFEEAKRLGEILGRAVEKSLKNVTYKDDAPILAKRVLLGDLPRRKFIGVQEAENKLAKAIEMLGKLRNEKASKQQIRTAECDWFGAEETLALSKAAAEGRLSEAYKGCLPAEIQIIKIGDWNFAGWPGEIFVEYALNVKLKSPNTFVISMANGELQGYVATKEAFDEGGYEASNALFSWETGELFVRKTLELVR